MRVEIIAAADRLAALAPAWEALARRGGGSIFARPGFLVPWWRAFAGVDELRLLGVWMGEDLVAVWPLRLRAARTAAFGARTLAPLGDGRTLERSLLCAPGTETLAAGAMLSRLLEQRDWDVIDAPVEADAVMEGLARVADPAGFAVDVVTAGERAIATLPPHGTPSWDELARARRPQRAVPDAAFAPAELDIAHGVDELHRLLRREWAAREEGSPALDPALPLFLKDVLPGMIQRKEARLGLVAVAGAGAIAADVVIVDGERQVQILRGTDPAHAAAGATQQLCWASLELAALGGARRFDLADDDSPLQNGRVAIDRMQLWNGTAVGRLHRGVASFRRRGRSAAPASNKPQKSTIGRVLDALAEARPASTQRLVERLGHYHTLHLYRGELFSRDADRTDAVSLAVVDLAGFDAMASVERDALIARLELPLGYTREKWRRGDLAVIASVDGRPAGIAWCARAPVFVPDIGRQVRPAQGECYIHEVFVHPEDRGRKIAPAMLDHLARYLRARDVYRAWALIERANVASVRAFERADYVAVADVVYVQLAVGSHLFVRPPDPEARALLGL